MTCRPLAHCIALILSTAALVLVTSACTSNNASPDGYTTVGKDPRRDSDTAQRLTAQAAQLILDNRYDEAEKVLTKALEADVMYGPAHNDLGMVYFNQKKLYLAAWEFEYASKLMPNQPEPRNNLGLVFEAAGKIDDAVTAYGNALQIEPDNAQLIGNLARARIRRGDHDPEVRDLLQQLVMKDNRPDWLTWARDRLALMHFREPQP